MTDSISAGCWRWSMALARRGNIIPIGSWKSANILPDAKDRRFSRVAREVLSTEDLGVGRRQWRVRANSERSRGKRRRHCGWERVALTMQVRAGSLNSCSPLRYAVVSLGVFPLRRGISRKVCREESVNRNWICVSWKLETLRCVPRIDNRSTKSLNGTSRERCCIRNYNCDDKERRTKTW